ncbi:MAG: hypothetical protein Q8P88_01535 [Candidatus Jorgensenbacteria bacterium]|nr:hypothetical protein [Candidatus Jorgensenbacteria bacterium]
MKLLNRFTLPRLGTLGAAFIATLLALPLPAHAQLGLNLMGSIGSLFSLGDISAKVVGFIIYILNYIIGFIGGLILTLAAWLVDLALTLNAQVLDPQASVVQVGWQITRDFANLGFVLVIIVIAVSIILRFERYGSQKLLTRLIAAAILVNFSLAIMGVFLQFAGLLTNFFMSRILTPGGNILEKANGLGSALASAFSTQRFLLNPENFSSTADALSTFGAAMLTNIASLFFTTAFTVIAIIVIGTFAIMLLVRYLYLIFLGVTAPLVWLFWVIPDLAGYFTDWWKAFIRWTFFAPAASFFIYLAFRAVEKLGTTEIFTAGADNFFEGTMLTVASQGAQMIVIAGIMIGGLMVANNMGIKSAEIGLNLANKLKGGAQAWAGRKTLQAGSALLRRKGTEPDAKSGAERIQGWAERQKFAPARYLAGWVARGAATLSTAGGEDQVKYHESQVKGMSLAETKAALLTATGPRKIAIAKKLTADGKMGEIDMTQFSTEGNKKLFASFGQGKAFGDAEKAGIMNVEMAKAINKGAAGQQELANATDKLVRNMTRKDMENVAVKDLFDIKPGQIKFGLEEPAVKNLAEHFTRSVISENPVLVPNIMPKLDAASMKRFTDTYSQELNDALRLATPGTPPHDELTKIKDRFDKTLTNYALGFAPTAAGAAPTPAPAPTPPPAGTPRTP